MYFVFFLKISFWTTVDDENYKMVELKVRYKKAEIGNVFKELKANNLIKISPELSKFREDEIPFLKKSNDPIRKVI